jgi:glycosyltransferase involved in cell wall biosynthesis
VSYKGLPLLLEAWRELCRERDDAILVLVGSGGVDIHNCEAELVEFVAAHGLERQVRFVGNVRNVDEYLQASDVFAFPSENEAFGISLIEAMACGLPVVSSNMGGLRDIVEHEVDGLAVEAGNREQLRCSLDRLLADPALGARLGETARKTAEQRYAADGVADRYAHLFQRLTDPVALCGAIAPPENASGLRSEAALRETTMLKANPGTRMPERSCRDLPPR